MYYLIEDGMLKTTPYLEHYGTKGMKWGVRRFQNKDGTRTALGKQQDKKNRMKNTGKDVSDVLNSLSDDDLKLLNYSQKEIDYMRQNAFKGYDYNTKMAHRVVIKDKNGMPVSYIDATSFVSDDLETGKKLVKALSLDIATRGGNDYRGKGYAVKAGKRMVKWFDKYGYKDYDHMEWFAKVDNKASQRVAEKIGLKKMDYVYDGMKNGSNGWVGYSYRKK